LSPTSREFAFYGEDKTRNGEEYQDSEMITEILLALIISEKPQALRKEQ